MDAEIITSCYHFCQFRKYQVRKSLTDINASRFTKIRQFINLEKQIHPQQTEVLFFQFLVSPGAEFPQNLQNLSRTKLMRNVI